MQQVPGWAQEFRGSLCPCIICRNADVNKVAVLYEAVQTTPGALRFQHILFEGELPVKAVENARGKVDGIHAAVNQALIAMALFPESRDLAFRSGIHGTVAVEIPHRLQRQGNACTCIPAGAEQRRKVRIEECVAIDNHRFGAFGEGSGQLDSAARTKRLLLHGEAELKGILAAVRRNPILNLLPKVADAENHPRDPVAPELLQQIPQERPAGYRRHTFGSIVHDTPKTRPKAAGKDDYLHYLPKKCFSTIRQRQ